MQVLWQIRILGQQTVRLKVMHLEERALRQAQILEQILLLIRRLMEQLKLLLMALLQIMVQALMDQLTQIPTRLETSKEMKVMEHSKMKINSKMHK